MKKTFSFSCFLLLATAIFAQKNAAKLHLGGLPTNPMVFSKGLGYERMVAEFWSVQLMFNKYGWDDRGLDGEAEITKNAVLETRHFFGKKSKGTLDKAFFVGCFVEGFHKKVLPGGEWFEPPPPLIGKRWGMGTGLVMGKNFPLFKIFFLECFAGPKLRYVRSVDYFGTADQYEAHNAHHYTKLVPRIGCNVGYRF